MAALDASSRPSVAAPGRSTAPMGTSLKLSRSAPSATRCKPRIKAKRIGELAKELSEGRLGHFGVRVEQARHSEPEHGGEDVGGHLDRGESKPNDQAHGQADQELDGDRAHDRDDVERMKRGRVGVP
jgi:hypothetical protein